MLELGFGSGTDSWNGSFMFGGGSNSLFFKFLAELDSFTEALVVASLSKGMYFGGSMGEKKSDMNLGVRLLTKGRMVSLVKRSACWNIFPIFSGMNCTVLMMASRGSGCVCFFT